jgi:hypothetical protein
MMPEAICCALCGQDVQAHEASVSTSDGQIAHVTCADAEAVQAWIRRERWAVGQGCGSLIAIIMLSAAYGPEDWVVVVAISSIALHMLIHRRFWYFVLRDLRRWW